MNADDGEPKATAEPGDDIGLVKNGSAYWWLFTDGRACENPFPVIYGAPLKGKPVAGIGYVAAKKLKVGVVYEVGAESSGSGYGSGWFKILPNGKIENYRDDPTPPVIDKDGYVVNESKGKS